MELRCTGLQREPPMVEGILLRADYDGLCGPVSFEIEDKTMPALIAIKKSIHFLHDVLPNDHD